MSLNYPIQVDASPSSYGPDGPWNAVRVYFGSNYQQIDMYPGNYGVSRLWTEKYCSGYSTCAASSAGLYNNLTSDTSIYEIQTDLYAYVLDSLSTGSSSGSGTLVPNTTLETYDFFIYDYPGSLLVNAVVPFIDIGSPYKQFTGTNGNTGNFTGHSTPNYLFEQNQIPSASFALHYGSAAFDIPISLWFGGYDPTRLVGDVITSQINLTPNENLFQISLSDISILTLEGDSPIGGNYTGLLAEGNSTIQSVGSIPTAIFGGLPYLQLPPSVCTAITKNLPVMYDSDTGLYLWLTGDSRYKSLIESPTVLSFTFVGGENTPINVPFALLNLTLEGEIKATPTPYFPCNPISAANKNDGINGAYSGLGVPTLGRSFLQAAFFSADWTPDNPQEGKWFLGQAPGPKRPAYSQATSITGGSTPAGQSGTTFYDTWSSYFKPVNNGTSSNSTSSGGGGLSSGAKAGIGVGVGVGVPLLLAIIGFFVWRAKKNRDAKKAKASATGPAAGAAAGEMGMYQSVGQNEYQQGYSPQYQSQHPESHYTSPTSQSSPAAQWVQSQQYQGDGSYGQSSPSNRYSEVEGSMPGGHHSQAMGTVHEAPDTGKDNHPAELA